MSIFVNASTNPFSTRWTRPGAIPYQFSERDSPEQLLQRLAGAGWRGAIVGPHGTGKSTLVHTLLPFLECAGRKPLLIQLHGGERRLRLSGQEWRKLGAGSILIVDGYEQLSRMSRVIVRSRCYLRDCGLLVTAHTDAGLPILVRTTGSEDTLQQLIAEHLPPHGGCIMPADIRDVFDRHQGNLREALFDLYDRFESRRAGL